MIRHNILFSKPPYFSSSKIAPLVLYVPVSCFPHIRKIVAIFSSYRCLGIVNRGLTSEIVPSLAFVLFEMMLKEGNYRTCHPRQVSTLAHYPPPLAAFFLLPVPGVFQGLPAS